MSRLPKSLAAISLTLAFLMAGPGPASSLEGDDELLLIEAEGTAASMRGHVL